MNRNLLEAHVPELYSIPFKKRKKLAAAMLECV